MNVLTLGGLDFGLHKIVNYMGRVCRSFATTGGRTQIPVRYPARLDLSNGDNPQGSIQTGARLLDAAIRATPGPKTVLGYSQGAQVVGAWMVAHAYRHDAPDDLQFILIGNLERRYGNPLWVPKTTPDDTRYKVWDVAKSDDGWCNGTNPKKGLIVGVGGKGHLNYWNTDLFGPDNEVIRVVGNTTYVVAP